MVAKREPKKYEVLEEKSEGFYVSRYVCSLDQCILFTFPRMDGEQ